MFFVEFIVYSHCHFGCLDNSVPGLIIKPYYFVPKFGNSMVYKKTTALISVPNIDYVYRKQKQFITNIHINIDKNTSKVG